MYYIVLKWWGMDIQYYVLDPVCEGLSLTSLYTHEQSRL